MSSRRCTQGGPQKQLVVLRVRPIQPVAAARGQPLGSRRQWGCGGPAGPWGWGGLLGSGVVTLLDSGGRGDPAGRWGEVCRRRVPPGGSFPGLRGLACSCFAVSRGSAALLLLLGLLGSPPDVTPRPVRSLSPPGVLWFRVYDPL